MTLLRCKAAFAFLLVSTSTLGFAAQPTIRIRFDYAGAEDLLNAIANKQVSNSDLSRLLAVKGVAAMVTNTIKYVPSNTRQGFESAVREVATSGHEVTGDYQLDDVVQNSANIRRTIQLLRAHQQAISEDIAGTFHRYAPMVHDVTITLHFVVGGVSDGFVLDGDPQPELFVALGKGDQDLPGIELNLKHEAFHVLQKVLAGKQSGMTECVDQPGRLSVPLRLACTTLLEGTASFVADATKASGKGPYIDMWRSRYQRNLRPAHLAADFKTSTPCSKNSRPVPSIGSKPMPLHSPRLTPRFTSWAIAWQKRSRRPMVRRPLARRCGSLRWSSFIDTWNYAATMHDFLSFQKAPRSGWLPASSLGESGIRAGSGPAALAAFSFAAIAQWLPELPCRRCAGARFRACPKVACPWPAQVPP